MDCHTIPKIPESSDLDWCFDICDQLKELKNEALETKRKADIASSLRWADKTNTEMQIALQQNNHCEQDYRLQNRFIDYINGPRRKAKSYLNPGENEYVSNLLYKNPGRKVEAWRLRDKLLRCLEDIACYD